MKRNITILWVILTTTACFVSLDQDQEDKSPKILEINRFPRQGDIPLLNRKIFKGQRVSIREHPYVASIRRNMVHYLTGALLSTSVVVTVAHPLVKVPVTELNVVLGENYCDRGTQLFTVLLIIFHKHFNPYTLKNDIALLVLYEQVNYKGSVKPIALTQAYKSLDNNFAFVTGWGRCDNMGTEYCLERSSTWHPGEIMDPMLRSVTLNIKIPYNYCASYEKHDVILQTGMLCTGLAREEDNVVPCLGVPGALLVTGGRLAGILSWGFGCGYNHDLPLIYTNMDFYQVWIAYNLRELQAIKPSDLSILFEATQAHIMIQWLTETRIIPPTLQLRRDASIVPLPIDNLLKKIVGNVYDVRDFIRNNYYHKSKTIMYGTLNRKDHTTKKGTENFMEKLLLNPFLSKNILSALDFKKLAALIKHKIEPNKTLDSTNTVNK